MAFTEAQIQNLKLLLQVQSDAYNDAMNRICQDVKDMKKEFDNKLNELQYSLEYTQRENDDLKQNIKALKDENNNLKKDANYCIDATQAMKRKIADLDEKIDAMDDKQRKTNLIISGLNEDANENNEQCHQKIIKLIKEQLDIPDIDITAAYRIGKFSSQDKRRDVLVRFRTIDERDSVFKRKIKLRGQNVFIREDFCKETLEVRKHLLPRLREARNEGKHAFIKYRELVVKQNKLNRSRTEHQGGTPSSERKVQMAVQRIEGTETLEVSPLPSPRVQTSPRTPKSRHFDAGRSYQLRQSQQIKYPK